MAEGDLEYVRESFKDLELRMNKVSQIGTRIGDRLLVSEGGGA